MRKSYPAELIQQCCAEYRAGIPVGELCQKLQLPRSTVYYWLKKYKHEPDTSCISTKKELDNMRRAYKRMQKMYEVLKSVNCTTASPLQTKLYELEKLYGQYPTRVLCEALDVDRGTFYNYIFRNKKFLGQIAETSSEWTVFQHIRAHFSPFCPTGAPTFFR